MLRRVISIVLIFSIILQTSSSSASIRTSRTIYVGKLHEQENHRSINHIYLGDVRIATVSEGEVQYIHHDHRGNPAVITSENGDVVTTYQYTPYGEVVHQQGAAHSKRMFNDQPNDEESGLTYLGARYYHPVLGRFITPDPVVASTLNPNLLNRYMYAHNNPVKYVDPSGHDAYLVLLIIGAIIGGVSAGVQSKRATGSVNWTHVAIASVLGAFSGASLANTADGILLLKASSVAHLSSQVSGAAGWEDGQRYLDYTSRALSAVHTAWRVSVGVQDWVQESRAGVFDVHTGSQSAVQSAQKVYTNGMNTKLDAAIEAAGKEQADKLFYNPTDGPIADLTESILQKLTGTSSIDRQLAFHLEGLEKINLIGHSQGSITVGNVLLNLGLRDHRGIISSVEFQASPLTQARAYLSAAMSGLTSRDVKFDNNFFDPINVVGPNMNPVQLAGGVVGGVLFGLRYHATNYYGR